ncbi:hypothetical protein LFL96_05250 [Paraburkholderia sp. D15]|nr:hypothetical protein [Paraburkholderia sp. D15]WGS50913.1 hypothetical protein LFL96_05250 [Paraburkholderia sp. D15]
MSAKPFIIEWTERSGVRVPARDEVEVERAVRVATQGRMESATAR